MTATDARSPDSSATPRHRGGIGARIALGFAVVIALMGGATVLGLGFGQVVDGRVTHMVSESWPRSQLAASVREQVHQTSRSMGQLLVVITLADRQREEKRILETRDNAGKSLARLAADDTDPADAALVRAAIDAKKAYDPQIDGALKLIDDNQTEQVRDLTLPQIAPIEQKYLDTLNALIKQQGDELTDAGAHALGAVTTMHRAMLGVSAAAALLALAIGVFTTRSVTRPLAEALAVARRVAEGDLRSTVQAAGSDETAQLLRALGTMNGNLRQIVAQVRTGTDEIAGTSHEIQSDCEAVQSRTHEQAMAIESTAAAIEELTATVARNASNAERANADMGRASGIASEVGRVMSDVVGTMVSIKERSGRIGEIVGVIDGIAFQTNILALNAAVEAARAGEQGRGFAVVAGEVRSLAQRASTASKEIRELIQRSVETVDDGNVLVDRAASMVQGMVSATSGVAALVSDIALASQQQHVGIEEFSRSVSALDRMAQQNTAFATQVYDAATSLHRNMDTLVGVVHVFKD